MSPTIATSGRGGLLLRDGLTLDTGAYLESLWTALQSTAAARGGEARLHPGHTLVGLQDVQGEAADASGVVLAVGAGLAAALPDCAAALPAFLDIVEGVTLTLQAPGGEDATATLPGPTSHTATDNNDLWPGNCPGIASMPYIAPLGTSRCVVGATWERPAAPDHDTGAAPKSATELLTAARMLCPVLSSWTVVSQARGARAVPRRTHTGTPPYAGRLELDSPGLPPLWLVAGLGSRGLLYHAWLGKLTAAAMLAGTDAGMPAELLRWKRK